MEDKKLFGMICRLQRELSRQSHINLSDYGLSGVHMHALVFVRVEGLRGRSVCQRDIERQTGLRPSSVSSMLGNLEKKGYLRRVQAEDDMRTKTIVLTQKGLDLCDKNKLVMDRCDRLIECALTEGEQEELKKLLGKVLSAATADNRP